MDEDFIIDFPDPDQADEDGMVGIGGNLSTTNLLQAYSSGIFPWSSNPVSWWSPDPRGILEIGGLHIGRSLRRFLKRNPYTVTFNRAFAQVLEGCARDRKGGTWIDRGIRRAFIDFHRAGYAHSVECWHGDVLAGGLYGVAIRGLFAGESMFSCMDNGSKVALVHLMDRLVLRGYRLMDIQMLTPATEAMGAVAISRREYLHRLQFAMQVECVLD